MLATVAAGRAHAHAFAERYDLPVPLLLYISGAGAMIAFSFAVVALFFRQRSRQDDYPRLNLLGFALGRAIAHPSVLFAIRLLAVCLFALVVLAGFIGVQNPFKNIAPTMVWVIWWVGMAYVCALLGDVWALINPWRITFSWAEVIFHRLGGGTELARGLRYPPWLDRWPAAMVFLAFVWTELVWAGSDRPGNIAAMALVYSAVTWTAMFLFGRETWLRQGEAFSVLFTMLARFAPTEIRVTDAAVCATCASAACRRQGGGCVDCYDCAARAKESVREWALRPHAVGLLVGEPVTPATLVFVLLMLSTVTFDGFTETPLWITIETWLVSASLLQPLLFWLKSMGADIYAAVQTFALFTFAALFLCVYLIFSQLMAVVVSSRPGRREHSAQELARLFVLCLVPIAIAYHFAHYLSFLLIAGQLVIPLASDPFGFGWDLFGTKLYRLDISIVNARFVWFTSVTAIVLGHIVAVYLAHVVALRVFENRSLALRSQYSMLLLMVAYTMSSLWILAQPVVD